VSALTVNPLAVTITPNNQTKTYGGTVTFTGTEFTRSAMVNGDSIVSVTLTSAGAAATAHRAAGDLDSTNGVFSITGSAPVGAVGTQLTDYAVSFATPSAAGPVSALTVNQAALSVSGTRAYDQTSVFAATTFGPGGAVSTGINGDTLVLTGNGTVGSAHVAAGPQVVNTAGLTINNGTGLATDYTFTGGAQTGTIIAVPVNLTATRVYDGSTNFTVGTLTSATITGTVGGETLTLASGTGTAPSKDVSAGTQTLTLGTLALGNGTGTASDYTLVGGTNTGTITRLASVTWTGGGGNSLWSNAANWAGGAIPDKNNVQNVNLGGATVTFDNTVPAFSGSVQVDNVSGGALSMSSGVLNVAGAATLSNYSQIGGTTITGTTFSSTGGYNQSAGLTQVGSNLSVSGGAVTQTGGGLTVGGTSTINAGASAISLTSGSNDFGGAVSLTGGTTQIVDANSLALGTLSVGALTVTSNGNLNLGSGSVGVLSATSNGGLISQSGPLSVAGTTNLQAGPGPISLTSANTFTGALTAAGANITITAANTLTPATISAGAGAVNLTASGFGTTGSLSGGSATLTSTGGGDVGGGGTSLAINFGAGSVVLTGSASSWNLSGPAVPQPRFTPSSQSTGANVFYNNGCISGPACAGVFSVTASIGASVSQIAAQALKDAQSTDSVAKQIDYGFAGDVGTTPPMDHRIDETGISTPACFDESREGTACK